MRLTVPESLRSSSDAGTKSRLIPTEALLRGIHARRRTDLTYFLRNHGIELNRVVRTLIDLAERMINGEELRVVISSPPRHGKTDTVLHLIVWLLTSDPHLMNAFTTYGQDLANNKSRRARRLAKDSGVVLDPSSQNVREWNTVQGGGLLATGAGGPLTGKGITGLGVVDDPFKNRQEAESALIRDRVWEWFTDVFYTRLEPGSSVIVIATRWHRDDLSGRLLEQGWEAINLPAIDDDGNALWPERYPVERLEETRKKIGEYTWASLYQGEPRPRGGRVYGEPNFYIDFPKDEGFEYAHGFDGAYTSKTYADYSVLVTGRKYGDTFYVTNMIRVQKEPLHTIALLKAAGVREVHWRLSGTEKGLSEFLHDKGIFVNELPAQTDKFVNAQPSAADWNQGKILLPHTDPNESRHGLKTDWVPTFIDEVTNFTGVSDAHDDIVDALSAMHQALAESFEAFVL